MHDMLRLLLLSDIHFLSLYDEMDCNASIRKAFLQDLKDFREVHGAVNHILVCGDIAYKGAKEEYDKAQRTIRIFNHYIYGRESL